MWIRLKWNRMLINNFPQQTSIIFLMWCIRIYRKRDLCLVHRTFHTYNHSVFYRINYLCKYFFSNIIHRQQIFLTISLVSVTLVLKIATHTTKTLISKFFSRETVIFQTISNPLIPLPHISNPLKPLPQYLKVMRFPPCQLHMRTSTTPMCAHSSVAVIHLQARQLFLRCL